MNKTVIAAALGILFIFGCNTDSTPPIKDIPIKSIRETAYDADSRNGKAVKKRQNGKIYNNGYDVFSFYNIDGAETITIYHDSTGVQQRKFVTTYGRDGKELQKIWYDANGQLYRKHSNEFDNNGKMTLTRTVDSANNQVEMKEKKYDASGNMTEEIFYTGNEVFMEAQYYYNKKGNKIKEVASILPQDESMELSVYTDIFNDKGWRTEQIVTMGDITSKNIYKHNKNGEDVSSDFYFNGEKLGNSHMEYVYDENGNWTTAIYYSDGRPLTIKERTIEYYSN